MLLGPTRCRNLQPHAGTFCYCLAIPSAFFHSNSDITTPFTVTFSITLTQPCTFANFNPYLISDHFSDTCPDTPAVNNSQPCSHHKSHTDLSRRDIF